MILFAQQVVSLNPKAIAFLILCSGLIVWVAIVKKFLLGEPILPYQPRRQVPWELWDFIILVLFNYAVLILLLTVIGAIWPNFLSPPDKAVVKQLNNDHLAIQLVSAGSWPVIVVGGLIIIVITPIFEEIYFRVFLQGWLEKAERNYCRNISFIRKMPLGTLPILLSSLVFAILHFRKSGEEIEPHIIFWIFICQLLANILSLIFAVVWMRKRVGATAEDLGWIGWEPKVILNDIQLGITTFAAIVAPIFTIQQIAVNILPKEYAPDPIPIFFFAIALGLLYNRTHRVVPSIALHMALNATSLILIFV